jgi:hypothetical protein
LLLIAPKMQRIVIPIRKAGEKSAFFLGQDDGIFQQGIPGMPFSLPFAHICI